MSERAPLQGHMPSPTGDVVHLNGDVMARVTGESLWFLELRARDADDLD